VAGSADWHDDWADQCALGNDGLKARSSERGISLREFRDNQLERAKWFVSTIVLDRRRSCFQ
jgi:hypothetical protein